MRRSDRQSQSGLVPYVVGMGNSASRRPRRPSCAVLRSSGEFAGSSGGSGFLAQQWAWHSSALAWGDGRSSTLPGARRTGAAPLLHVRCAQPARLQSRQGDARPHLRVLSAHRPSAPRASTRRARSADVFFHARLLDGDPPAAPCAARSTNACHSRWFRPRRRGFSGPRAWTTDRRPERSGENEWA